LKEYSAKPQKNQPENFAWNPEGDARKNEKYKIF